MEHKNLAAAVCAVMDEVRHVTKTGKADPKQGGYKYASDADLLTALQPAMAKHGLAIFPSKVEQSESQHKYKSSVAYKVDLIVTYTLCHANSDQTATIQAPGCGIDGQDKSAYVAMTGAFKYALRQLFAVPTGDDPEAGRHHNPAPQRPNSPAAPLVDAGWPVNHADLRRAIGSAMDTGRWTRQEIAAALGKFGAARVTDIQKPGPVADLKGIIDTTDGPGGLRALGAEILPTEGGGE